jgi:lipoprotein-anchoring transpeptidase ErfK/SrfK
LLLAGFLALLFFVLIGSVVLLALLFFTSDLIFPGVEVMGARVGSMTAAEAEVVLQERWQQQLVTVEHSTGTWPVALTDLGMTLDSTKTVQQAYAQGRSLDSLLGMMGGDSHVQPVWSFDAGTAESFLRDFSAQVAVAPVNAAVRIEQGQVIETPPANGRVLDMDMTMAHLTEDPFRVLVDARLPLATRPVAPAIDDVSELVGEAQRLLATTVTIRAYDPIEDETAEWAITPQDWGSWLSLVAGTQGEEPFEWVINEDAVGRFLTSQLPSLGEERYLDVQTLIPGLAAAISTQQAVIETRIYHHPRQHIVQAGETLAGIGRVYGIPYPWIQQANPGSDTLQAGDVITIPSVDEMLPFEVVENKRIVVNIGQQRVSVYEDGQPKWEWPASTGIDSSPTAPGIFQIQSHEPNAYASNWDLWMPNFMGIYRPVPTADFMNGFHGFPTRNGSTLLWTGDLGHQVTYGCVLLSSENASLLYDWAEEGVVVEVQP